MIEFRLRHITARAFSQKRQECRHILHCVHMLHGQSSFQSYVVIYKLLFVNMSLHIKIEKATCLVVKYIIYRDIVNHTKNNAFDSANQMGTSTCEEG